MHTDIPIRTDIERLIAARDPSSVTMYLPTCPVTRAAQDDRIAFKNLAAEAADRLRAGDVPRARRRPSPRPSRTCATTSSPSFAP